MVVSTFVVAGSFLSLVIDTGVGGGIIEETFNWRESVGTDY